jgi:MscS family membrane protein
MITASLVALQTLGFSISGVLAFGGVGGIAVGFAAKDLLANFFGGLMVYLDRPFSVGDWIRSPDRNIEGTVEEIGWRLTMIRTFDKRPLYVPNATFTSIAVENPSRMLNRRIYETIGIRYDDADKMEGIVREVEQMLRDHPEIDTNQTLMVNFNKFAASSLDFFIYTFTRTTVWTEYHKIKQDVLLKINAIITKHGAEIAFPTSTIHLANSEPLQSAGA